MAVVVLDAANVATISVGNLSVERLREAINVFVQQGLRCIAFAPRYWMDGTHLFDEASKEKLQTLIDDEKLVLTPPQAHDDYYVIDYAMKHNGYVVTNDMFRDHVMNKRRFNGEVLTTAWVKAHCIDFTFVGTEFLPNSQLMDVILREKKNQPNHPTTTVEQQSMHHEKTSSSPDTIADQEMEPVSNTKRKVDLSEAVYIQVPPEIVRVLHDNDDAGLRYFMDMSGTYMTLPTIIPSGKLTTTLSIHGSVTSRDNCEIAMHAVHSFLHEYIQQQQQLQQEQMLQNHQMYQHQQYYAGPSYAYHDDMQM
ncbi:hypothetical protein THRCLA_00778 [Thraustotheca clavata]|uniref:RNase NYN domain-containing protein n=1 Tax=Thraustotheca clavata TaxID=74557 RepID=A0A1W0AA76_9STRA|nr:hypothetical protein THRCLA_00778 [Thraustotheca clavata]